MGRQTFVLIVLSHVISKVLVSSTALNYIQIQCKLVLPEEDAEKGPRVLRWNILFSAVIATFMRCRAISVFLLFPLIPPPYFLIGEKPGGKGKKRQL